MHRLIFALGLALLLASCGGSGDSSPSLGSAREEMKAKVVVPDPTLTAGPVSLVNTTTPGDQDLRTIGATDDGGYSVGWTAGTTTLYTQHYDSLGVKDGSETVASMTFEDASNELVQVIALAILPDGKVVAVYRAITNTALPAGAISTKQGIYFQIFSRDGVQVQGQTEVTSIEAVINSRTPGLTDQQVIALADGSFIVAWNVRYFSSQFGYQAWLFFQRYDSQGQKIGDQVEVGQFPGLVYRISADSSGGFVIYTTELDASYRMQVSVRHVKDNSTPTLVVAPRPGWALLLPLATGYVLFASDSSGTYRQMLDSEGNAIGESTAIPSLPVDARELADGTFLVFWDLGGRIEAQRYAASGSPLGNLLLIESGVTPQLAALSDVGFALAWSAPGGGGDLDVFTQQFSEQLTTRKKACQISAKGLRGQERKAFITSCLGLQ